MQASREARVTRQTMEMFPGLTRSLPSFLPREANATQGLSVAHCSTCIFGFMFFNNRVQHVCHLGQHLCIRLLIQGIN